MLICFRKLKTIIYTNITANADPQKYVKVGVFLSCNKNEHRRLILRIWGEFIILLSYFEYRGVLSWIFIHLSKHIQQLIKKIFLALKVKHVAKPSYIRLLPENSIQHVLCENLRFSNSIRILFHEAKFGSSRNNFSTINAFCFRFLPQNHCIV